MSRVPGFLKNGVSIALLGIGVLLITAGLVYWLYTPTEQQDVLVMAAGERIKTRYELAHYLERRAGHYGLSIQLIDTKGSFDVLKEIQEHKVDIAFVHGGIRLPHHENIRQVARLNVEPLQLLVRPELVEACSKSLTALAGKRVNLGNPETGTYLLSSAILEFADLSPDPASGHLSYIRQTKNTTAIWKQIAAIKNAELEERKELIAAMPDALFHVSTMPSRTVRQLVDTLGYRLVPLPYADAFSMVHLTQETSERNRIEHMMIVKTVIPPFAYGVSPAVPAEPCETVGANQLVIAHKDVSPRAVEKLLTMIFSGTFNHLYHPPALADVAPQYTWHAGAVAYRDRNRPLVRAEMMETLRRVTTILASILTGTFALYGFYRWRQVLRFKSYYADVSEIEAAAKQAVFAPTDTTQKQAQLRRLTKQLDFTRDRAIEDFADGYFRGESVVLALLSFINSTQLSLHHLLTELNSKAASQSAEESSVEHQQEEPS